MKLLALLRLTPPLGPDAMVGAFFPPGQANGTDAAFNATDAGFAPTSVGPLLQGDFLAAYPPPATTLDSFERLLAGANGPTTSLEATVAQASSGQVWIC